MVFLNSRSKGILMSFVSGSRVIWITGLSGSGKSTLANDLTKKIRLRNRSVIQLDGDELREIFGVFGGNQKSYSQETRLSLALRYGRLCKLLSSQGDYVIISTISLLKEVHVWNRANLPGYLEIYLKVPISELKRRDTKGIYKLFDSGQITNVVGIDIPIDEPINADFVYDFLVSPEFNKLSNTIMEQFIEDTI